MIEIVIAWRKNCFGVRIYVEEELQLSARVPITKEENKDVRRSELLALKYALTALKPTDAVVRIYSGQLSKQALVAKELKSPSNRKIIEEIRELKKNFRVEPMTQSEHRDVDVVRMLADPASELPPNSIAV
ncbi:MAG: hypothetical protein Q8K86_09090 [Candidatus Nanopelagicaceae bacterium]|nr:hypothetical protein [Candidatus Nanopelagicaceae bacterium]